jgi:hypothetical protein
MALGVLAFGGSWLLILTLLALDLAGVLHRGAPFRWQATGLLIIDSAVGISAFTHRYRWSGGPIATLQKATIPVLLAGLALVTIGVFVHVMGRRRDRRRSADSGG